MTDAPAASATDAEARRNALILAAAGAFNGAVPTIAISLGGLAGFYLLGPNKAAGDPADFASTSSAARSARSRRPS